jgi:quinone-modifying oxidoreductase subunit QmoB
VAEEKNIGVYVCTGCQIGDAIDTALLKDLADEHPAVRHCSEHPFLCSPESRQQIIRDIHDRQLDSLVLAACSPRHATANFTFDRVFTERVNLREGVAWTMEPGHEDTQAAAEDYLRMGLARTETSGLPDPYLLENPVSDILVMGGGISGMQAALESARAGYQVLLVEKESSPGGWLKHWHDIIPVSGGKQTNLDFFLGEKLDEISSQEGIQLLTGTTIASVSGEPGAFDVDVDQGGRITSHRVGAIVLAIGWQPYDASRLSGLKYNERQNIITQVELEGMMKAGKITRPSDNGTPSTILFLQCAGSRDEEHLPYCSNTCCLTSLKQAQYIRTLLPETNIFIVYKDIRTPGKNEHYYREVQSDPRVFFTKGEISGIEDTGNGSLGVTVEDNLLGETIRIAADMIVAATGMVPNPTEELNLTYRKGSGLPERKYGFPDSHFICFPYETQRTGIYAAGAVRAPMGIQDCMEDAAGAALKAIQCIEQVKLGEAVHPRPGDRSYPVLTLQRCTDCKRCTEECPFGSYDETESGTPLPNPARCRRCGICMGSCPERIINFEDYSIHAVSSMIKAIPIPDEFEETPRILAFICENDAYPAFDLAARHRLKISPYVRIIPVRCIGSINTIWLSDALSQGFDGILQIGCKPGEDYQCHFITGSELMETRSENIQETLQTMMLEPERIETVVLEIDEYARIPEIIDEYIETIEEIGPNPFKDM